MLRISQPNLPETSELHRIVGPSDDDVTVQSKLDQITTKTDNLPANTATVLGTPADGSLVQDIANVKAVADGIRVDTEDIQARIGTPSVSLDASLVALQSSIDGLSNVTTFSGNVNSILEVPEAGTNYYRVTGKLTDSAGAPKAPDLNQFYFRVLNNAGAVVTGVEFSDASGTVITPEASGDYAGWFLMNYYAVGRSDAFIGVGTSATKRGLTVEFGFKEATVQQLYTRVTQVADYESTVTTAAAVWDELKTAHQDAGSFGKAVVDLQADIGTVQDLGSGATISKNLGDLAGATFSTGTDSNEAISDKIDALDAVVDGVQTTASNAYNIVSSGTYGNAANQTSLAAIMVDTEDLQSKVGVPVDLGGTADLGSNLEDIAGSGFSSTTDSLKAISDAIDAKRTNTTLFRGVLTTGTLNSGGTASEVLEFISTEGVTSPNIKILMMKVSLTGAPTNVDFLVYEKTGTPAEFLFKEIKKVGATGFNFEVQWPFMNQDTVPLSKIYVKVLNNTAVNTVATVELRGEICEA